MITVPSRVDLRTFPSDDGAFRLFVDAELARLDSADPDRLQCSIRVRYPLAVVRVRSDLARLGTEATVWYAFRRAAGDPPEQRWWDGGDSWAIIDRERVFLGAGDAFAAIVEVPAAVLIGRRLDDLANPLDLTAAEDVAALWMELLERGEVHGTLRFNRLDGSARELEYHVDRDASGSDRYRAAIRELVSPPCK